VECLATKLLSRGDTVSIERGQLVIQPASGKPVPPEWINTNRARLCREALISLGLDAFEYTDYSTGHYGKTRSAGITLRFVSLVNGESVYAVFNADLTRQRPLLQILDGHGLAIPSAPFSYARLHGETAWRHADRIAD